MITASSEPIIIKNHPIFRDWRVGSLKTDIMTGLTVSPEGNHPREILNSIDPFLFRHNLVNSSSFELIMAIATTSGYLLWPNTLIRDLIKQGAGTQGVDDVNIMKSSLINVQDDVYIKCRAIIDANVNSSAMFFDPGSGLVPELVEILNSPNRSADASMSSWPGPFGLSICDWNILAGNGQISSATHCLFQHHTIGYGIGFYIPNVLPIFVDRAAPWSTTIGASRDPREITKHNIVSRVGLEMVNWLKPAGSFQFPLPYRALDDGEEGSLRKVSANLGITCCITLMDTTSVILIPVPETSISMSSRRRIVHHSKPLVSLNVKRPVEVEELLIDSMRWGGEYKITIPSSISLWTTLNNNCLAVTASGRKPIPSIIDQFSVNEQIYIGPGIAGFKTVATTTSLKSTSKDSKDYEMDITLDDSFEPITQSAGPIFNEYALNGSIGLTLRSEGLSSFSNQKLTPSLVSGSGKAAAVPVPTSKKVVVEHPVEVKKEEVMKSDNKDFAIFDDSKDKDKEKEEKEDSK